MNAVEGAVVRHTLLRRLPGLSTDEVLSVAEEVIDLLSTYRNGLARTPEESTTR
jgi:hypothetical protein